jgi:hypothetical protein
MFESAFSRRQNKYNVIEKTTTKSMEMLVIAAFVYLIVWPLSLYTVYRNGQRYLKDRVRERLPDIMHMCIPESDTLRNLTDFVPVFFSVQTLALGIIYETKWLCAYVKYMLSLQTLRCLMFNVTLLPDPSGVAHFKPLLERYFLGGIHDLMFSGHIMYTYAPVLFLYRNMVIGSTDFTICIFIMLICMIQILSSRLHYTIDLIVAVACSHWMYDIIVR